MLGLYSDYNASLSSNWTELDWTGTEPSNLQGISKKNCTLLILQIFRGPSIVFSNCFFLLKTEIHMLILNTKPFLYGARVFTKHRGLKT